MRRKLLMLFLLGGTALFAHTRVFVGFGFGGWGPVYAPAPVVTYAPPPPAYYEPAPVYAAPYGGAVWIPGYYYPVGPRWVWRGGYWGRRPFVGAVWVGPRYYGGRYFGGYWRR
ncbi:MAG: hypothetical protein C5B51_31610 [Terriglobia bacterium]|nr:MAG: hypothetical protein C5B51_31610 [Terriglobia bacterium]